jgi:arginine deiminase
MSNTPRTDRYELYYIETGNVSKLFVLARELESELAQSKDANARLMRVCDNLESQLADMTKQRDHCKAACDQYSEDEMLCKLAEVTKQRDALAEALEHMLTHGETHQPPLRDTISNIAFQALATVKIENHATLQR